MERKIFEELLELKRIQLRSGANLIKLFFFDTNEEPKIS
jgi:hypothetical protein